jgi:hypothetical protein
MSKWVRIVGEHIDPPKPKPEDPQPRGYFLETVANEGDAGPVASPEQRARLLYERGEGPQAEDGKPEPIGGPRQGGAQFSPADRAPRVLDGRGEE